MFEYDSIVVSALFFTIFALYVFGSIVVGILSKQMNLGFRIGFIWSIIFTPFVGLFLVLKNFPKKEDNKIQ